MPQLKQSAKRLRQSIKRAVANKRVKDNIDYLLRNFKKALTAKNKEQAQDFAKKLIRSIDKGLSAIFIIPIKLPAKNPE